MALTGYWWSELFTQHEPHEDSTVQLEIATTLTATTDKHELVKHEIIFGVRQVDLLFDLEKRVRTHSQGARP